MVSVLDNVVPAVESARRWLKRERADNVTRDQTITRLNNAYDCKLYNLDDSSDPTVISRTLTDPATAQGEGSNPRFSEVPVPMVSAIADDWKSVMALSPNHFCPPDNPGDDVSERAADKREAIVRGIFSDSSIDFRVQEGAHYRTLHGAELRYALPDPTDKRVRIESRSPYRTYARLLNMRRDLMYMAWDWEEPTEFVLDMWPQIEKYLGERDGVIRKGNGSTRYPDKLCMSEWYDRQNRIVLCQDKWVEDMPYVNHKWGFVPGQVVPNIVGVGLWGKPDVLHAIHIAQLYSEMLSMAVDGVFQAIYDTPIIFDDNVVGKIQVGPTEVLQMSSKAHTGSLRQNVKIPEVGAVLEMLERLARIGTGWNKTQSGEMDSPVISGKAFVAAQGPVAARAALKHVVDGMTMASVTGYALRLYEHHFPNDEISIFAQTRGLTTASAAERSGAGSMVSFVPSRDIKGNYLVLINYPTGGTDEYRNSISKLQKVEAGIMSKETFRQLEPGMDAKAERTRVSREKREEAMEQAEAATVMARASLAVQQEAQLAAAGAMAGQMPPQTGGQASAPAASPQENAPQQQAPAQPMQPARQQAAPGQEQGRWERVTQAQVRNEIAGVRPIRGDVWLMGAIARLGWTTGVIEVGLSDMNDKSAISQKTSIGQSGRLLFHKQVEPPTGQSVNVTPKQQ